MQFFIMLISFSINFEQKKIFENFPNFQQIFWWQGHNKLVPIQIFTLKIIHSQIYKSSKVSMIGKGVFRILEMQTLEIKLTTLKF